MGDDLLGSPGPDGQVDALSKVVVQIDRWFARTVSAVIVKSAEMADVVKPVPAHVIPNGVDMNEFRPLDPHGARKALGWPEGARYILFPGNPDNPRKGYALAQPAVTRAATQLKQPLQLIPLRNVSPAQVPLYMNACDAMVMTSLIEGSPNVVKEAMACNLPVIAVPVGDVVELLHDVPGYRICPRNVQSLADALVATLMTSTNVDGRTAIKRRKLDLESVAQRLMAIYEEVLQ